MRAQVRRLICPLLLVAFVTACSGTSALVSGDLVCGVVNP